MLRNLIKTLLNKTKETIMYNFWLKKFFLIFYNKFWKIELKITCLIFEFKNKKVDIIYVNPSRIKYELKLNNHNKKFYSNILKYYESSQDLKYAKILGGDWDLSINLAPFENTILYISFYNHFINNYKWEDTGYYNSQMKENFANGDFNLRNNLKNKLKFFDKLYSDIKKEGYDNEKYLIKSNKSLSDYNNNIKLINEDFEIVIAIGRSGELILLKGHHIITIFKLLNLENVPVKVLIRHSKWVKFRKEILSYLIQHGLIYQPLIHPDLTFIKSSYDDKRFLAIRDNLTIKKGTLLDIGANFGYFCHKFEDLGFECYAVELLPQNIYFMKKLREIEKKKFKIINKSIFSFKDKNDFDIVLALNVFHHFLKDKNSYEHLINLLNRLKMKELYFQTNNPEEFKNAKTYKILGPEEFVQFIIDHSCLKKKKLIYIEKGRKKRKLFKLCT